MYSKIINNKKNYLIGIFIFALIVRIISIIIINDISISPKPLPEPAMFAKNILDGKGYSFDWYGLLDKPQPSSFIPPLYVGVLVGCIFLAHGSVPIGILFIQLFQAILSSLTPIIVFLLGKKIFGYSIGIIASLIVSLYPPFIGCIVEFQTQTIEIFLLSYIILSIYQLREKQEYKIAILAGFLIGLLSLLRPTCLFFLFFFSLWFLFTQEKIKSICSLAIIYLTIILLLLPWTIRNYIIHHHLIPIATYGGWNLYLGNVIGKKYLDNNTYFESIPEDLKNRLRNVTEIERDKILYEESISFIKKNPIETLQLAFLKLYYFWWFRPAFAKFDYYPKFYVIGYKICYGIILFLSILGIILTRKTFREILIIYLLMISFSFTPMIFAVSTRYRIVLEPFLIILAAYTLSKLSIYNILKNTFFNKDKFFDLLGGLKNHIFLQYCSKSCCKP